MNALAIRNRSTYVESGDEINRLQKAIEAALLIQSQMASSVFTAPINSRAYSCSHCERPACAMGYCNAHYIRHRKGLSLDAPVRARKRADSCEQCGVLTGAKGGWGLCPRHYKQQRYRVIKDALIAAMGGKCCRCAGMFHRSAFDFHHQGDKLESPSSVLANLSAQDIARELSTCILICANCHRMEHHAE